MQHPMQGANLLPNSVDVPKLSKQIIGGYILEWWHAVAANTYGGSDQQNEQNFLNGIERYYDSPDLKAKFGIAWRWLIENEYIVQAGQGGGWYWRTTKGRSITSHDQIPSQPAPPEISFNHAPDFGSFTGEPRLGTHMYLLWHEAVHCYKKGDAFLATVVMLGSLVEAALLAMVLKHPEQASKAKAAPKDNTKHVKQLDEWSLDNFIKVARECGWIHESRHRFSDQLRDYRNFVHPYKAKDLDQIDKGVAAICSQVAQETLRDLGVKGVTD